MTLTIDRATGEIIRPPSTCGCKPHCALHESAGPVENLDCLPAAIMRLRAETYGIERLLGEATDPTSHPDHRARARASLLSILADLRVATAMVDAMARGMVGR